MSRLEGNALKRAKTLKITRVNIETSVEEVFEGVDAVCLPRRSAGTTRQNLEVPPCRSGIEELLDNLFEAYHLDDQDLAWTSIDRFFSFKQTHDMDFQEYVHEWESHFEEAEKHGGLGLSEPAKCWLFWSRTNLPDRTIADLRLKVDGDLTRWRHMIGLQLKITKNEFASREQAKDYRGTYNLDASVTSRNPMVDTSHAASHFDITDHCDLDYADNYWEDDLYDDDEHYDEDYDDHYYDDDYYYTDENYDETYYDDYYGGKKGCLLYTSPSPRDPL